MQEPGKKPVIFVFSTAYHPFIGGAEVAIEQVAKRLKNEFDFLILTSRMRKDLLKREVRDEGVVVRVGFGNRFDKFLLPILGIRAAYKFKKNKTKIILWGMDLSFGALAGALFKFLNTKIPFVVTLQYGYGDERVARGRFGIINLMFRFMLQEADRVTAISSYLLDLARRYGYIGSEALIHNGVDLEKFTRSSDRVPRRMTGQNPTIITVSRLVPKNGVDVLIRAFAELKKDIPDIKLHIIGDGPERGALQLLTTNHKLQTSVEFFGNIPYDELPKYLSEADVFVRPSRSEGMGNAFVEALAAGVPIIGTPVGGILDIIKDHLTVSGRATGLFAKVDDPKDLAEKIKTLLKNKELAAQIVANGRKMVEERFSWDKIARNYAEVFNHEININKRILIVTGIFPPEIGGPATYSKILLDELPKNGFGVAVATYGVSKKLPWFVRHALFGLRVFLMAIHHDILYAQDAVNSGVVCAISAFVWRKKLIIKVVGDYAWEQGVQRFGVKEVLDDFLNKKYSFKVELLRKVEKFVANRADKIIVPSEYLKSVVEKWGVRGEKIRVIYNAFDFKSVGHQLRRPTSKLIISAGRLVPWKGFGTLIEIMPEILKEVPETRLVIIGDGPEREKLELQITNYKLQKTVILTGNLFREKVLEYLAAADVFVLNTAYEGFSHQILEAMAIGVPIVTTDSGGNPELIENGKEGFLVKFNDKDGLKKKILEILKNPEIAGKLGEAASQKSREFSKERMIEKITRILT
ncbi:hypothetical protein A3G55_04430 [Candidatus Giovannonibacteria bacterium RIFCSPLOWO2_12_FULL_44_25]|uniref:Glycosyltransferase n=1 Tax=Candidatus Giovannonibacteria bacterium RIFCSPHIGHO2_02_FULL_45_40 TaxID=1798337 RepID=A0A1F5W7G4_9BACT|nr:MAG: hypothetical protein A2120_01810 [Candidatus Giovannonibacteria bacterium GWA2_45_15]OGF59208.1 MAG: hypothetical protein A2W40_04925 [Candidatus Giovannonibacteria bacterium RIFCSPHIGHO2_01_45_12]OGF60931.1 MAG: hypothetical protein A2656_03085 [Candidatus Giovannonibacteria bacterium RIFCSPHIGHO2_01_FULL_44_100]OGF71500.1 MAG: hypothetical protein A3C05_01910 [Candidatus Giovannonibacteria bacterium RIFCSPHIGHO2_02_FULL_45_40]OGF83887.1 MAG: hypothetical protein A3E63_04240 [Candidatu